MKKLVFVLSVLLFSACASNHNIPNPEAKNEIAPQKNDEGEWDLDVLDTQYHYFLNAVAKPINMYSEGYLKNKNTTLVTEWNSYYYSGQYKNIIESSIDYNPQENYGIKFEYKLYQVFAYVKWKYNLRMKGLGGAEVQ